MTETPIGKVSHFWPKAGAAALELEEPLRLGDRIRIRGHGHDFVQQVTSMQIEHEPVREAAPGDPAAVRVMERVHEGDEVLRVREDHGYSVVSGAF